MSQVKPGPNMEEAVAMKVSRRESREEKSLSTILFSIAEEGGPGLGARVLNMKWLL